MTDDSKTSPPLGTTSGVAYSESSSAPFIYFDGVSCHGTLHGVIEIELAARIMAPLMDGTVQTSLFPQDACGAAPRRRQPSATLST